MSGRSDSVTVVSISGSSRSERSKSCSEISAVNFAISAASLAQPGFAFVKLSGFNAFFTLSLFRHQNLEVS